ncbi:MAG: OsmC family protein [Porticoccus sp.]|nr:OsmC family protein [Porticoccus sp.]
MGSKVIVKERAGGIYTQDILARSHRLYADEPEELGGADLGPSPFEYVLAGLGSCTTITLRMYAGRKGWPVTHIGVDVAYKKSGFGTDMKSVFSRKITIEGNLDAAQLKRMMAIADKCPVHKMLEAETEIRTELVS